MNSIVKNWQENKQEKEREYRTKTSINKKQKDALILSDLAVTIAAHVTE